MAVTEKRKGLTKTLEELQEIIDDAGTPAAVRVQAIRQKIKVILEMPDDQEDDPGIDSLFE